MKDDRDPQTLGEYLLRLTKKLGIPLSQAVEFVEKMRDNTR